MKRRLSPSTLTTSACPHAPSAESGSRHLARSELGQRAVDIIGASVLLLGVFPVLLILMVVLRASSASVLTRDTRVGRGGRPFACLTLRTGRLDGDRVFEDGPKIGSAAPHAWETSQKLRTGPRVTSVGRFLRATSLDELPQLFNVLRGDMSLVGPRPVAQSELDEHYGTEGKSLYCSVRPGLTGLWQLYSRSDISYRQRVELDVLYVRERSLALDVKILLRTPSAALRRDADS